MEKECRVHFFRRGNVVKIETGKKGIKNKKIGIKIKKFCVGWKNHRRGKWGDSTSKQSD